MLKKPALISKNKIKYLRSLASKKFRDKHNAFIIEGEKIILEALSQFPEQIQEVYARDIWLGDHSQKITAHIEASAVSEEEMKKISSWKTPQPVLAVCMKELRRKPSQRPQSLSILLDDIQDPGNLGTIIRLADWFGIQEVFCSPNTADCYNPKAIQASMGAIFRVNVTYQDLEEHIAETKKANPEVSIYASSLDGEDLYSTELKLPAFIIMGNESKGIASKIQSISDNKLRIPDFSPSKHKTESLNVAIATSIICSEFRKAQHYSK